MMTRLDANLLRTEQPGPVRRVRVVLHGALIEIKGRRPPHMEMNEAPPPCNIGLLPAERLPN